MKYIIMCGGTYIKFQQPRQLLVVAGERIVDRTIRLLKQEGITDMAISTNNDAFKDCGAPLIQDKYNSNYVTDGVQSRQGFWLDAFYFTEEPVTYLFGDVFYSDELIHLIVTSQTDDILFFGTDVDKPHPYFKKKYDEPFAFKVVNQKHFREGIGAVKWICTHDNGRHPIAWELYRYLFGYPVRQHIKKKNYIYCNDYSSDIDNVEDVKNIEEAYKAWQNK